MEYFRPLSYEPDINETEWGKAGERCNRECEQCKQHSCCVELKNGKLCKGHIPSAIYKINALLCKKHFDLFFEQYNDIKSNMLKS